MNLDSKSLAELHQLASEADIKGYRGLRREDLIEKLDTGPGDSGTEGGDAGGSPAGEGAGRSGSRSRRRRGRGRDRSRRGGSGQDRPDESGAEDRGAGTGDRGNGNDSEPELEEATGILEILPRGAGLVKAEGLPEAGIHVSPAQIKRCQLRAGDEVQGPVRPARRGERRPSLVRIEQVNGGPPEDERAPAFEQLTPVAPHRHIPLEAGPDDLLARSVDLLVPLAFGQRVLVEAEPRSGRTSFLRSLAKAIAGGSEPGPEVTVLLVDERPEEVTAWGREVSEVTIAAAPADLGAHEQVRVAERALAKAKRQAEAGEDVVIMVDSLTRLGAAYGDAGAVKPFFGCGRELEEEEAGSVTVIATALSGAPGDQDVMHAIHTTENAAIRLDAGLAAAGIVPSLDVAASAISGQEAFLDENEIDAMRRLKAELRDMVPAAAAARLAELIKGSETNRELLGKF